MKYGKVKLNNLAKEIKIQKMRSVLFLQSEEPDPYVLYKNMLSTNPVFRDDANNITGIYCYENCKSILNNPLALIPSMNNTGLNEHALIIANRLTRFSNPPAHTAARQVATAMLQCAKPYPVSKIVKELLMSNDNSRQINWVDAVCKQLPVLILLKGLGFSMDDCKVLTDRIGHFVKIMQPNKTKEQITAINEAATDIYPVIERHILTSPALSRALNILLPGNNLSKDEWRALCISNLAGLMTQSYDACRGLLSNAMLQMLTYSTSFRNIVNDGSNLKKFVVESLRYDPPVQNTRRIAADDIILENWKIEKGEMLLLVLAAANRDESHFSNPDTFDIDRNNNTDYLTFGTGSHACLAADFAIGMTMEAMHYFFNQYPRAKLDSTHIQYEAVVNGRLPKNLFISLT
jgi:cytochrome P450